MDNEFSCSVSLFLINTTVVRIKFTHRIKSHARNFYSKCSTKFNPSVRAHPIRREDSPHVGSAIFILLFIRSMDLRKILFTNIQ